VCEFEYSREISYVPHMPKVSNWGKYGKRYCKGWEEEADLKAWVIGLVLGLFWQQFVLVFFEEPGNTDKQSVGPADAVAWYTCFVSSLCYC